MMDEDWNYRLTPAIAGVNWRVRSNDGVPDSHVLSIIELTLKPNVDISNVFSPEGLSWKSALRYVSTIPGCIAIRWGYGLEDSRFIILLIQWDSGIAWKRFQHSMGISIFAHFFEQKPFNRAILQCIAFDELHHLEQMQFFTFAFDFTASQKVKSNVSSAWETLISIMKRQGNSNAWGKWLEIDLPNANAPIARQKAEAYYESPGSIQEFIGRQRLCFIGFFASRIQEKDVIMTEPSIKAKLRHLDSLANYGSISKTFRMSLEVSVSAFSFNNNMSIKADVQPSMKPSGVPMLFTHAINCQYVADSCPDPGLDLNAIQSLQEIERGKRKFPRPCGWYNPMGHLNQYVEIPWVGAAPRPNSSGPILDFYSMKMKPGFLCKDRLQPFSDETLKTVFFKIRMRLAGEEACESVYWGNTVDVIDTLMLFICWKNTDGSNINIVELLVTLSPWLAGQPEVQRIPLNSSQTLLPFQLIEVTTFFIAKDRSNPTAFEGSYYDFQRTMQFIQIGSFPTIACRAIGAGWSFVAPDAESISFVAITEWQTLDARDRWYRDFEEGMQVSYERFGSKIEALWNWTGGRVDSQLVRNTPIEVKPPPPRRPTLPQCGNAYRRR